MFEWEDEFAPHILERGWRYARNGAVQNIYKEGNTINAVVAGSEYYKVELEYDGCFLLDAYCSCPYAANGNHCKHMAAVLYVTDMNDENSGQSEYDQSSENVYEEERPSLKALIEVADRNKLEQVLLELAAYDPETDNHIRLRLAAEHELPGIRELKRSIDSIFDVYSDKRGFINYHNAFEFSRELTIYLEETVERLMRNEQHFDAFELTIYAFIKLGSCDIDDDGEISDISNCCYDLWQKIAAGCRPDEKERIRDWFDEHSGDGSVADYMEDTLKDFREYELASDEELKDKIAYLDQLIEESKDQNKCKTLFTVHYGYYIEAIELRIIFMRRRGATEEEVDAFRRKHMHFRSMREYYIEKARKSGDEDEEIDLLKQSKKMEKDSSYYAHCCSERLIELYHGRREYDLEKNERREVLHAYRSYDIEDFRGYRDMCTEEEWIQERNALIEVQENTDRRCRLYAEEKMTAELFDLITNQEDQREYFDKYGFLLAEDHAEYILKVYEKYVSHVAGYARNRAHYDELARYLKRMQKYKGGRELVSELCRKWIEMYSTRKVMVEELGKYV